MKQHYGTGRRKSAIARVFIRPGTGAISVNKSALNAYFGRAVYLNSVQAPLLATGMLDKVDVITTVKGGGSTGQADAIKLGVARALADMDPELREPLKRGGYLTRDPRRVERKKYGKKGARASFQYSKR